MLVTVVLLPQGVSTVQMKNMNMRNYMFKSRAR